MKDPIQFIKTHPALFSNIAHLARESNVHHVRIREAIKAITPLSRHESLRLTAYLKFVAGLIHETFNESGKSEPETIGSYQKPEKV
jgi:Mn-containing catalase